MKTAQTEYVDYRARAAAEFAERITALGFTVYLAESGRYGFITDNTEKRVLSFSFDGIENALSGNYGPPSTQSGTGWRLDFGPESLQSKEDVRRALYALPAFCGNGWKYLTTVKQHLAEYGASSRYTKHGA